MKPNPNSNLSFAGCGFNGLFHIGVAKCFHKYAPEILSNRVSGASAGSLVAAAIVCGMDLEVCAQRIMEIAGKARESLLQAFDPRFNINKLLYELLDELLPEDCHIRASNKLNISVTRMFGGWNKMISEYASKADVIQAILCSCYIPGWTNDKHQKINGVRYIDGGFSVNQPILNEHTITVSPFYSPSTDISPYDHQYTGYNIEILNSIFQLTPKNLYLFWRMITVPNDGEMIDMMIKGYEHAFDFMKWQEWIPREEKMEHNIEYKWKLLEMWRNI